MEPREVTLHGHRLSYRAGGSGPLLVLIHGITASAATWDEVLPWLAERHAVVAPDLFGHGRSAKPRGDYSLGAYANGIRDLLEVLGHPRATIVGHSLGGGIALQFAYQYPERCERLVLVSSGGLGREVHAGLRAAALPGSEWVLPLICTRGLLDAVDGVARFVGRAGLRAAPDLEEIWRGYASLGDADCRQAFVHTLRTIIDPLVSSSPATDAAFWRAVRTTLVGSMMPALIRSSYSSVCALNPKEPFASRTFSSTTEPSWPALRAIQRSGSSSARRTTLTPAPSSSASLRESRTLRARSSATPPPATMPPSTAARVARR